MSYFPLTSSSLSAWILKLEVLFNWLNCKSYSREQTWHPCLSPRASPAPKNSNWGQWGSGCLTGGQWWCCGWWPPPGQQPAATRGRVRWHVTGDMAATWPRPLSCQLPRPRAPAGAGVAVWAWVRLLTGPPISSLSARSDFSPSHLSPAQIYLVYIDIQLLVFTSTYFDPNRVKCQLLWCCETVVKSEEYDFKC